MVRLIGFFAGVVFVVTLLYAAIVPREAVVEDPAHALHLHPRQIKWQQDGPLGMGVFGSVLLGMTSGTLAVIFFLFEIGLVATLQAFIFSFLTAIYIGGAVADEH